MPRSYLSQSTGGQRAVNGTGGTSFGLHLNNLYSVAEDVLATSSRPLIDIVGHGAGGGNGVDASNLSKGIADMSGSSVAVHCFEFSSQNEIPPKGSNFVTYMITSLHRFVKILMTAFLSGAVPVTESNHI